MGMVTGYLAAIRLYVLPERNFEAAIQYTVARFGLRKCVWTSKELERKREIIHCLYMNNLYFCVMHGSYIISRGITLLLKLIPTQLAKKLSIFCRT
jgi:hypothetical protein